MIAEHTISSKSTLTGGYNEAFLPSEDFYMYVNHHWQKKIRLPPYNGSYGVSEEVEDELRDKLLEIIQSQRELKPTKKISKLATSFLQYSHQKNSVFSLMSILNRIHCLKTNVDIASFIGELNRIQSSAPLSFVVSGDSYNISKCCVFLYEADMGLPGKHYYSKTGEKDIQKAYGRFLKGVGDLLYQPNLEKTFMIESAIIPYLSKHMERDDINFIYNPYTFKQLIKKYKSIPWMEMFREFGLSENIVHTTTFIVTNERYCEGLEQMFTKFDIEAWRIWLSSMVIRTFVEYLPPPFDDLNFELYGRTLKGITEKIPQKYLTLKVLKRFTPMDLGKLFVKKVVPSDTKTSAIQLVKKLKQATMRLLENITWMSKSTKNMAIKKVDVMKFQVAYPKIWDSETKHIQIEHDQPLQNLIQLNMRYTNAMIKMLENGNCERTEDKWDDGPFEVNAYYYSEGNMMVIPAGILRYPFFDLDRGLAWNLGGIGSAIGHEITHGFDVDGRMYDSTGTYKNWWTDEDAEKYEKLTKKILNLFDGVEYMGGKVDGELTLSENLSDLGGMSIALEALNETLGSDMEERKKAYRDFFTSYAISWRNKDRPLKASTALFTNSHSPAYLRVNVIVKQFEEFYIAFDIKPEDKGWIAPKDRVTIW